MPKTYKTDVDAFFRIRRWIRRWYRASILRGEMLNTYTGRPARDYYFEWVSRIAREVETMLLLRNRKTHNPLLPLMPDEVWDMIIRALLSKHNLLPYGCTIAA